MQHSAKSIVSHFINEVRSGEKPENAGLYMAATVKAHQVISGKESTLVRTPVEYTQHIEEFLACYGHYDFEIQEILADEDKVYVRWKQQGHHLQPLLGYAATQRPLETLGSAVYRVEDNLIVEYWIQQENQGLLEQLQRNFH